MKGQRDFMHSSDVSVVVHGCPWPGILITLLFFATLFSSCIYFQGLQLLTLWHAPFIISVLFLMLQFFEFWHSCVLSKILLFVLIFLGPAQYSCFSICKPQLEFSVHLLERLSFSLTSTKSVLQKSWLKCTCRCRDASPAHSFLFTGVHFHIQLFSDASLFFRAKIQKFWLQKALLFKDLKLMEATDTEMVIQESSQIKIEVCLADCCAVVAPNDV